MSNYEDYLNGLNQDLERLEVEPMDVLRKSEQGIKITTLTIKRLRDQVVSQDFVDQAAEIHFFKHIKPQVLGKLIYYRKLYVMESKRPRSTMKLQRQYLIAQIDSLQSYFDKHHEFCRYYRSDATILDTHYFLRSSTDVPLYLEAFFVFTDPTFSTSHDCLVAIIIAYNKLILYMKKELVKLDRRSIITAPSHKRKSIAKLFWTGNKVDLIELIYALYASGAINRGTANINEIANTFETLLETDLGDYYHTYSEIRSRKIHRTKFLDKLKDSLDRHMLNLER